MAKAKSKKVTIEDVIIPIEEQPYVIPENWCWTSLSSVAEWGSGGTPSRKNPDYYEGNIPWIKTGELDDGYIFDSEEKITEDAVAHSSAKLFPTGSVLVAMYGATIGKTAILGIPATTNQACACARCNDSLDNKYLFYYLRSQKYSFIAKGKGGAQPNISQDIIKSYPIPLPPLAEQKRIVEQIENLFSKLDEAKEKTLSVVESFELREKAIYKKAFDGDLTNSWRAENGINISEWEEIPFEKLGKLERGRSKHRPRNDKRLFGGKYPFIQTGDVAGAGMYVTSHKQTLSEFGFEQSRMFPKGTLCITIAANIGDAAILSYDCCFPDSVVGFTPGEKCLNKYMYFYLQEIKAELEYIAPATAQKNLNLKLLGKVEIKVPSLKEQEKIVEILEKQINDQENIVEKAENVIETIDVMKKSILAKAFRGELGTNIETEESAIKLLKSIF